MAKGKVTITINPIPADLEFEGYGETEEEFLESIRDDIDVSDYISLSVTDFVPDSAEESDEEKIE